MNKAVLFFAAALACGFTATAQGASKDVNGDGRTDASDIQLVVNASLGLPVDFNADINGDQRIDAADIQIVTAIALGTIDNLFPGYGIKIFDRNIVPGDEFEGVIGIGIFLVRDEDVTDLDPAASYIQFLLDFDPAVLELLNDNAELLISNNPRLRQWYLKRGRGYLSEEPTASLAIYGRYTEMTTFDDQIRSHPLDVHDPRNQDNPFLLATIFFRRRPGATGQTALTIRNLRADNANSRRIDNFDADGATIDLDVQSP
jgi:hypothetical protein